MKRWVAVEPQAGIPTPQGYGDSAEEVFGGGSVLARMRKKGVGETRIGSADLATRLGQTRTIAGMQARVLECNI